MPYSRRRFLQATTVLQVAMLHSPFSFACTGGPSNGNNYAPLPEKDFLSDGPEDGIEKFLDKTYGKWKWKYSNAPLIFRVPELSESPYQIPVGIKYSSDRTNGTNCPRNFSETLDLYVQRPVYVVAVSSRKRDPSYNKSLISWVAKFELGACTLLDIETRIQLLDSGYFRLIAVLSGWREKVEVVKQNGVNNIVQCIPVLDGYVYSGKANSL